MKKLSLLLSFILCVSFSVANRWIFKNATITPNTWITAPQYPGGARLGIRNNSSVNTINIVATENFPIYPLEFVDFQDINFGGGTHVTMNDTGAATSTNFTYTWSNQKE